MPSEDSNQPGHPPSLIRFFAVRRKKPWVPSYPLSAQRRLWSDWVNAQADLSLRWADSHIVGFVTRRLKYRHQNTRYVILWEYHWYQLVKWATWWQNQQNDLCSQRILRSALASEPSLYAQWVTKGPGLLRADSEDSDQTGQMPRLIWDFAGCTGHFVGFCHAAAHIVDPLYSITLYNRKILCNVICVGTNVSVYFQFVMSTTAFQVNVKIFVNNHLRCKQGWLYLTCSVCHW